MKKTFIFGLIAAALGFTACSSEGVLDVNNDSNQKGMVLRATAEQPTKTRATIDNDWTFAFSQNDNVFVRNDEMGPNNHYMFTKGTGDFTCVAAIETKSPVTWYAYFPQVVVYLFQQSGKKEDVANLYALSGTTASTTTGKDGLSITMEPQVAILVIDNQRGSIDINVKTGQDSWVHSLKAKTGEKGFDLVTAETKVSLFTTNTPGTYYIAVPAGVQLAVKNGDTVIKSTGEKGLTAGKYYNLRIFPFGQGEAAASVFGNVKWVQLWDKGPKFAEYNVGARSATDYGGLYCWGMITDKDSKGEGRKGDEDLSGNNDTATMIWGENWRMPTKEEFDNLIANCTVERTNLYGLDGCKFTGKGDYSSNSVFLPAAGCCDYGTVGYQGGCGFYWSSTYDDSLHAYGLYFDGGDQWVNSVTRSKGCSVRAVLAK